MAKIRVTPRSDVSVGTENGKRTLDAKGETVEDSVYWRRRANEGDVDLVEVPDAPVSAAKNKQAG